MSTHFSITDEAIGQGFTKARSRNGMRCKIIGGLEFREWMDGDASGKSVCYLVRWADGEVAAVDPDNLAPVVSARATGPAWGFCGLNPMVMS